MTTKTDYTADEWAMIVAAPLACTDCIIYADMNVTDAMKENERVEQLVQEWKQPGKTQNELIQAVMTELHISPGRTSGQQTPDEILNAMQEVVAVVDRKAPADEAREFKQFLYTWADMVANASGEGFLGEGETLSAKEASVLQRLQTVLGLT
jgi:hypothetical protein